MSVNCNKYANKGLSCEQCIHWSLLQDFYIPKTYEHLCSICGMRWFDENIEDPEFCPQCHNEWE